MDFWRKAVGRNSEIRRLRGVLKTIMDETEQRKLRWYGQVRRMEDGRLPKAGQNWEIAGRYRRRRLLTTWGHNVKQ